MTWGVLSWAGAAVWLYLYGVAMCACACEALNKPITWRVWLWLIPCWCVVPPVPPLVDKIRPWSVINAPVYAFPENPTLPASFGCVFCDAGQEPIVATNGTFHIAGESASICRKVSTKQAR